MMKKIGILFTSRNNYEMFDIWFKLTTPENFEILNIDEDSTIENKKFGKYICEKYNIKYIDREEKGMFNNIKTASMYFRKLGVDWIIWFQHDCFPLTKHFFSKLNSLFTCEYNAIFNKFGLIGFNALHGARMIRLYVTGLLNILDVTGRAPLELGDGWYRNKVSSRVDYSIKKFDNKIFAVESVANFCTVLNLDLFDKYIEIVDDYYFFHAWDDIAFQFLKNNVYNVCIPNLVVAHDPLLKTKFGIPSNSPKASDIDKDFYWGGKKDYLETWKKRWGFDYTNRNTFEKVKEQYKGTLLWDFYHHDPINGPLKTFEGII